MRAAEDLARKQGRSLLVLDTAVEGGASGLYERLGYTLAGVIPYYALKPHGGLSGTKIFWKWMGRGDYTSERQEWLDKMTEENVLAPN